MRLPVVRHGDPTTTGGKVVAFDGTIHDNGKVIARNGNQATCGNCKGLWNIVGTGEGMSEGGRVVVIQGDCILCPCRKNHVIAGADVGCFVHKPVENGRTMPSAIADGAEGSSSGQQYDEQFRLYDGAGNPLTNTYYTIRDSASALIHGVTDSMGLTDRHVSNGAKRVAVYLGHRE